MTPLPAFRADPDPPGPLQWRGHRCSIQSAHCAMCLHSQTRQYTSAHPSRYRQYQYAPHCATCARYRPGARNPTCARVGWPPVAKRRLCVKPCAKRRGSLLRWLLAPLAGARARLRTAWLAVGPRWPGPVQARRVERWCLPVSQRLLEHIAARGRPVCFGPPG